MPVVPADFAELETDPSELSNRQNFLEALDWLNRLKARYHRHAERYSPWQYVGDQTQNVWQYVASPLSQHGAIVPPPYGELIDIERQLVSAFHDPNHLGDDPTDAKQALDKFEARFRKYEDDSKNGRETATTLAKVGVALPAAPFVAAGWPFAGAGVAAAATAAVQTGVANAEAAIEGKTLSWSALVAEAGQSGGTAFLSVFVWAKLSPYFVAKLPGLVGERVSEPQLQWLGQKLGGALSREQLVEALGRFSAELWANVLAAGASTSFELTFEALRSKGEMSVHEFAASLATNMLVTGGVQVLAGALTHRRELARRRALVSAKDKGPGIAELLAQQRARHPHLAEPVPWHGTEPLELSPQGHAGRVVGAIGSALSPREIKRIMARINAFACNNLAPEEADLFLRDLKNWQQHPLRSPDLRRVDVDASRFLAQAQWIRDRVKEAIDNGHFAKLETRQIGALLKAHQVLDNAETLLAKGEMSAADQESLWRLYTEALKEDPEMFRMGLPDRFPTLQTSPTLSYLGHFGVERNNVAGVLNIPQRGYLPPNSPIVSSFTDYEFPLHDGFHVNGWGTEFAPSFHSYLAAMDRRIDFAEAFSAFKKLFTPREQSLLETARFAVRWENRWAPTGEHTWAATREPARFKQPEASNHVVQQSLLILKEQGRTDVTRDEMEEIVRQLRQFSSAYLDSVADGALRKRNALFQAAIVNRPWGGELRYLMARMGAPVAHDPQWETDPRWIQITLGRPTFSPEEVLTFLKDDEILHAFPKGMPQLTELRGFCEAFILEHPIPAIRQ